MSIKIGNPILEMPLHFYLEPDEDDDEVIKLYVTRGGHNDLVLTLDEGCKKIFRGYDLDCYDDINIEQFFDLTSNGEIKVNTDMENENE